MTFAVCLHLLNEMSYDEFFEQVVRGAMKTPEFTKLMSSGIETLDEGEKKALCDALTTAGLPMPYERGCDATLNRVVWLISSRAVEVR